MGRCHRKNRWPTIVRWITVHPEAFLVREQITLTSASQNFILSGNPAGFLMVLIRQASSSSVLIPEADALHDF
jgi:hypothetical protein